MDYDIIDMIWTMIARAEYLGVLLGLHAPIDLSAPMKFFCLSICTVCSLFPRLDVYRYFALHEVRLKDSMCLCSCRLVCNLFDSFRSLSWGWVWLVLGILTLISIALPEIDTMSKSFGASDFASRFLWIWSGRFQSCCNCSFHWDLYMADWWCSGRWFCAGLVFLDFAWAELINCFKDEYR